jgi:hypothetical protein
MVSRTYGRGTPINAPSFNGLAKKSHTTLAKMPEDLASEKVAGYELLWASATPIS